MLCGFKIRPSAESVVGVDQGDNGQHQQVRQSEGRTPLQLNGIQDASWWESLDSNPKIMDRKKKT